MSGPINNMAGIGMIVCMVVGFTSIYAISFYYHQICEFDSRPVAVYSIQLYSIKFITELRHIFIFLYTMLTSITFAQD